MSGPGSRPDPARAAATGKSHLPAQCRTAIVGVLPFANLSDTDDEYFSDGLTEDLIHALSLQSFYRVLSRNSTFSYKGKNLSTRLIAREIDASYLIQGSVRRAGSKIRVTAELIAPENGEQLWTGRYDRDMGDLFAMQDEITTNLSAAIATEIYRAEASAPARTSNDVTAWDRFLKGLSHYYRQTKADFETAIALFEEAIALDPGLSIAHAYLATIMAQGIAVWMDQEHARIVVHRDEPRRKQCSARPRSSFAFSNFVLSVRDRGASRGGHGRQPTGGGAEPVRHGRPRRSRHVSLRDRRTSAGRSSCFRWRRNAATAIPDTNGRR